MSIVQRATNILTKPKEEWLRIASEPATAGSLFGGYAVILAALAAIGSFIGTLIIIFVLAAIVASLLGGMGGMGSMMLGASAYGLGGSLVHIILMFVIGLAIVYGMGLVASALAPSFGGIKDDVAGLKTSVYASTANWVGGMLSIVPILGWLASFILLFYSIYLFYLGSVAVQKVPQDKAVGFTAVIAVIWLVGSWVVGFIVSGLVGSLFAGASAMAYGY